MAGERENSGFSTGAFLLGVLTGAVVGGAAALLLAPKSGRETRDMIRSKAEETQQMLQDNFNDVKERVGKAKQALATKGDSQ
jgi:gas vesicle protein